MSWSFQVMMSNFRYWPETIFVTSWSTKKGAWTYFLFLECNNSDRSQSTHWQNIVIQVNPYLHPHFTGLSRLIALGGPCLSRKTSPLLYSYRSQGGLQDGLYVDPTAKLVSGPELWGAANLSVIGNLGLLKIWWLFVYKNYPKQRCHATLLDCTSCALCRLR